MNNTTDSTDHDPSTNGSGASRTDRDTADIFSDLSALRLSPDEAGQIGSEEVLAHVSVASRLFVSPASRCGYFRRQRRNGALPAAKERRGG